MTSLEQVFMEITRGANASCYDANAEDEGIGSEAFVSSSSSPPPLAPATPPSIHPALSAPPRASSETDLAPPSMMTNEHMLCCAKHIEENDPRSIQVHGESSGKEAARVDVTDLDDTNIATRGSTVDGDGNTTSLATRSQRAGEQQVADMAVERATSPEVAHLSRDERARLFVAHFCALIRRYAISQWRSRASFVMQLLAPMALLVMLYLLDVRTHDTQRSKNTHNESGERTSFFQVFVVGEKEMRIKSSDDAAIAQIIEACTECVEYWEELWSAITLALTLQCAFEFTWPPCSTSKCTDPDYYAETGRCYQPVYHHPLFSQIDTNELFTMICSESDGPCSLAKQFMIPDFEPCFTDEVKWDPSNLEEYLSCEDGGCEQPARVAFTYETGMASDGRPLVDARALGALDAGLFGQRDGVYPASSVAIIEEPSDPIFSGLYELEVDDLAEYRLLMNALDADSTTYMDNFTGSARASGLLGRYHPKELFSKWSYIKSCRNELIYLNDLCRDRQKGSGDDYKTINKKCFDELTNENNAPEPCDLNFTYLYFASPTFVLHTAAASADDFDGGLGDNGRDHNGGEVSGTPHQLDNELWAAQLAIKDRRAQGPFPTEQAARAFIGEAIPAATAHFEQLDVSRQKLALTLQALPSRPRPKSITYMPDGNNQELGGGEITYPFTFVYSDSNRTTRRDGSRVLIPHQPNFVEMTYDLELHDALKRTFTGLSRLVDSLATSLMRNGPASLANITDKSSREAAEADPIGHAPVGPSIAVGYKVFPSTARFSSLASSVKVYLASLLLPIASGFLFPVVAYDIARDRELRMHEVI